LARLVSEAGGELVVADMRAESSERAARELNAEVVDPEAIYDQQCDVFAPCAMGATVSEATVPRLRAKIVCGAANNQLATTAAGRMLLQRNIAYAPDYVANAGGILNAFGDFSGTHDVDEVWRKIDAIGATVEHILGQARQEQRPSSEIADEMAERILTKAATRG
jgi:leucine dehydrogenase